MLLDHILLRPSRFDRLLESELPEDRNLLRRLVELYFENVHHLRCFAFIHKPSFMREIDLDEPPSKEQAPLRHIICAHGAKYVPPRA